MSVRECLMIIAPRFRKGMISRHRFTQLIRWLNIGESPGEVASLGCGVGIFNGMGEA